MTIIQKGTPPKDRIWRGTCRSCGSIVEAKESELKHITPDRDGAFSWEVCPHCSSGGHNGYGGVCFYLKNVNIGYSPTIKKEFS